MTTYQYDGVRRHRSAYATLSVERASLIAYRFIARSSITQYTSGPITQKVPIPTAMTSGHCQLSQAGRAQVGELSARNDPRRAMVRFTPKANDSSFPLNQRASAVVTETMSDSAP